MVVKFKYKVGSIVYYNSLPYEVDEQFASDSGKWYVLKNRIGYLEESELKRTPKR